LSCTAVLVRLVVLAAAFAIVISFCVGHLASGGPPRCFECSIDTSLKSHPAVAFGDEIQLDDHTEDDGHA
jgi:hypothetical protein